METSIRRIFLTGQPGVGKSTLIRKLHEHFVKKDVMVSGILTEEVRTGDGRTGFRIRSLTSGEEGWLARKSAISGPRIGSYSVNSFDLDHIGAQTLENAARGEARLVFIDEVGPMEMTSSEFRRALAEVLSSQKGIVASVKHGSHYPEVEQASKLEGTVLMEVTSENRDAMFAELVGLIGKFALS